MRQITMVLMGLGLVLMAGTAKAGDPYYDRLDRAQEDARRDADRADKKKLYSEIDRRRDEANALAFARDTRAMFNLKPGGTIATGKPDMSRFDALRARALTPTSPAASPGLNYGYRTAYAVYVARNGSGWIYYGAWYDAASATQAIKSRQAEGYATHWTTYSAYGPMPR